MGEREVLASPIDRTHLKKVIKSMTNFMKQASLAVVVLGLMPVVGGRADAGFTVYVTADKGSGTTVLGTLNLSTGQYTQIATMSVSAYSLTTDANGTLYAGASNGKLYTVNTSNGATTQFGTITAPVVGGVQEGFLGLAYAGASGFYGANINAYDGTSGPLTVLDQISSTATSVSSVGSLGTPAGYYTSGGMAMGPNGSLYTTAGNASEVQALFGINTTTGAATQIGSGFGGMYLGLVTVGGTLYGIDESQLSGGSGPYYIYTINTTTGVATSTGVAITGLGSKYEIDAVAFPTAVPEPSSLALCGIAAVVGLAALSFGKRLAA